MCTWQQPLLFPCPLSVLTAVLASRTQAAHALCICPWAVWPGKSPFQTLYKQASLVFIASESWLCQGEQCLAHFPAGSSPFQAVSGGLLVSMGPCHHLICCFPHQWASSC